MKVAKKEKLFIDFYKEYWGFDEYEVLNEQQHEIQRDAFMFCYGYMESHVKGCEKELELLKSDFNKLQSRYSETKSYKIIQKLQLYECIGALEAIRSDYFVCGEYFRKGFKYHGLTEQEIAEQTLNTIKELNENTK